MGEAAPTQDEPHTLRITQNSLLTPPAFIRHQAEQLANARRAAAQGSLGGWRFVGWWCLLEKKRCKGRNFRFRNFTLLCSKVFACQFCGALVSKYNSQKFRFSGFNFVQCHDHFRRCQCNFEFTCGFLQT